jgi:trimeric autotransporter adhesin
MRNLRIVICTAILLLTAGFASAQQQDVLSNVAGTGTSAPFFTSNASPTGVAVDSSGNVYIIDNTDCVVYELSGGALTVIAGTPGSCGYSGDGAAATSAQLSDPIGLALDSAGDLFIADSGNCIVREVMAPLVGGNINTIAGTPGTCSYTGDGGPATSATLNFPVGVAVDGSGDVFISDFENNVIREVSGGTINTAAGSTSGAAGFMDESTGMPLSAEFNGPYGMSLDSAGNLYIADSSNYRIRKLDTSGNVTTVAGNGGAGYGSDGVAATSTTLDLPLGVTVDGDGDLTIADTLNQRLRWVDTAGIIQTIAGNGTVGASTPGLATNSDLDDPITVAVDSSGNIYFTDLLNYQVDEVTPVSELASPTTSLTFSLQAVGTTSSSQPVVLTATGYDLNISNVAFSGTNSADFTETDNCPRGVLASGNTCTVSVSFAPTGGGTRSATLVVTDNSFLSTTVSVTLTGTATAVSFSPPSLSFPSQTVGTSSAPMNVTLTNNGTSTLTISSITASGDFLVTSIDGCEHGVLAGGTSCGIGVEFRPTQVGVRNGSLSVVDTDPASPQMLVLQGTGNAFTLSPNPLVFASQLVETPTSPKPTTLTNQSPETISGITPSFSGPNAGDFAVAATGTTCAGSLAGNRSCRFNITFTPSVSGAESATLTVASNVGGMSATAMLQGTGKSAGADTLSPNALYFSLQIEGTTSATKNISVTNHTKGSLTISATTGGANAGDFQIVSSTNPCDGPLAAGASCTYGVAFSPSIVGAEKGTLLVNDGYAILTATLSGTGTTIVTVSPKSFDYGTVQVYARVQSSAFKVTNTSSTVTLGITGITIGGANPTDFTETDDCGSSIAPKGNCTITATFSPQASGPRSGTIQIADNGGGSPQIITLTGTGE